jgi:hypothetical protein
MVVIAAALIGMAVFAVTYLESGTSTGKVTLDLARAYQPGTISPQPEHNLYLIRLNDRRFFALSDLDAANRDADGRRCRVAPIDVSDPALPGIVTRYRTATGPDSVGLALFFREECNGAIYDATGIRVDQDGRNLDRHPVSLDAAGKVIVDLGKRTCSEREGATLAADVTC